MEQQGIGIHGAGLRAMQIVTVVLLGLKLLQLSTTGVFQDEAYYWMWSQHPSLSYFDHPPLNAWLLWLSSHIFGWNRFALRLPVALSVVADIVALWMIARRLDGTAWQGQFWLSVLLLLATPVFWLVTSLALPDYVLLATCLLSIAWFTRFFMDRAEGQPGRSADLYLAAIALGFAGLSKYNAAILAIGVGLYVIAVHRSLLREPRLYLAAAITLVMQAPVVYWNLTEGLASWEFILRGRHNGLRASYDGILGFAFGVLILISPFLFWPIVKFVAGREAVPGTWFARVTFVLSSLVILAVCLVTLVLPHWNLVAYLVLLPFLPRLMRPYWLIIGQTIWGLFYVVATIVNYGFLPISDVEQWRDEGTGWSYGWGPIAAAVEQAKTQHRIGFVAAPDYTTASLLGFYTHDAAVTSLSAARDEFDYWFDPEAHAGEDALLFDDNWRPMSSDITSHFTSVTPLVTLPVVVGGKELDVHRLYFASGYKPNG